MKVVVERVRTQIQRQVFEVPDDAADPEAYGEVMYRRCPDDPFTGRTEWTYTATRM